MKKLIGIGIAAMMVMGLTGAANAVDNDWLVSLRASNDAAAKTGAASAIFGVKTAVNNAFSSFSSAANLGASPEVNYSDAAHPYSTNYNDSKVKRYYVAKYGGAQDYKSKLVWNFRAVGAAGATIYLTAWNFAGASSSLDANPGFSLKLYEADDSGNKVGDAIWVFNPGVATTWASGTGIAGVANKDYFSKAYTLGAADASGAAYQNFVLETPEPGSIVAMLSGLVGLAGFGIRRKK